MDINNLRHVVGKAEAEKPAIIRFFNSVTKSAVDEFVEEFLWLQNCVQPSKIIVMINSEGGSVIYGMSAFSVIHNCPIEVDCVIEGIAASMGSVLWAAGKNLYMHDYSILMIHNPFSEHGSSEDPNTIQMVNAFRSQLSVIYQKRFGLTKEKAECIMNGTDGADGTFLTVKDAIKAGFIDADHVIKTSKQICTKVKNQIDGVADTAKIREIMLSIASEIDGNKLIEDVAAIHKRKDKQIFQEPKTMENNENTNFDAISAQLGFSKDTQMTAVSARISNLIKAEADLKLIQDKYNQLEIQFKGKEADLSNIKSELDETKASLKKYQDAEKAAFEAEIAETVQNAIKAGKIEDSAKESWLKMAHTDFETVKATLASIQGREDINKEIANDPANVNAQHEAVKTAEEKMASKVAEVCGEVQLNKF